MRVLGKLSDGKVYLFAGSRGGSGTATFTVPSGTTATVIGESRTLPISNGSFTDSFADGDAVHIYQID